MPKDKAPAKAKTVSPKPAAAKIISAKPASAKSAPAKSKAATSPAPKQTLVVGSRGSTLALTQSTMMVEALRKAHKNLDVRLEIIKTVGDMDQKTKLHAFPGMGVFVKELQVALLNGSIDCAVHSLKDVPEDEPEGLVLTAFPPREDPRDVFISSGTRFRDLPHGSKVGTGSPRRVLQLKAIRPDIEYVAVRGNVDTRVGKVRGPLGTGDAGTPELQGVVLAAAGLNRMSRNTDITHPFSLQDMVPAIGQASLALECRENDARVRKLLSVLDDELTHEAVTLERRFMKRIGGGCKVPMAAHVYPYDEGFRMIAVLGNPATGAMVRVEQNLPEGEEDEMLDEVVARMESECAEKGIPLPRDLPEHHLLQGDPLAGSAEDR